MRIVERHATPRRAAHPAPMTAPRPLVLIASRSPAYVAGMAAFVDAGGFEAAVAHTADAALALAGERSPAAILVDSSLGDASAAEIVPELGRRLPGTPVLVCLSDPAPEAQMAALAAGACGVVLHTGTREAVVEALRDALRGHARLDLEVVRALARGARRERVRTDSLTDQEKAVLRLMRQQLPYKEIAARLGLSWHTVRSHAQAVLTKLGVHSRRDLDAWDARFEPATTALLEGGAARPPLALVRE
jgi:two-component system, NarL family, nitrate/nitrite response regulator NarL